MSFLISDEYRNQYSVNPTSLFFREFQPFLTYETQFWYLLETYSLQEHRHFMNLTRCFI